MLSINTLIEHIVTDTVCSAYELRQKEMLYDDSWEMILHHLATKKVLNKKYLIFLNGYFLNRKHFIKHHLTSDLCMSILQKRDFLDDLGIIHDTWPNKIWLGDINSTQSEFGDRHIVYGDIQLVRDLSFTNKVTFVSGDCRINISNYNKDDLFDLNLPIIKGNISIFGYSRITNLVCNGQSSYSSLISSDSKEMSNIIFPKISGDISLYNLEACNQMIFPRMVVGSIYLPKLDPKYFDFITMPKFVTKKIYFKKVSMSSLFFLKSKFPDFEFVPV